MAVEPVKAMQSTSMCSASALPAVWPKPGTTLNTPSGNARLERELGDPQRGQRRLLRGLEHQRIAAASTGPIFQAAISSGKFHGTMAPTTPMGSRVIGASARGPVGATSS